MSKKSKIWLILGFFSAVFAYSFYGNLWDGAWYDLTALSFFCYTRVIYNESRGKWSLYAFIIHLTTVSALLDEWFFDPTKIEINEYIGFIIMVIIVMKFKGKWMKSEE
jgi:hypothetical protein